MANKRRAANRMRHRGDAGGKHLENREEYHTEHDYSGGGHETTRSSGSHAHIGEYRGPGVVPGADELPEMGPGKAAKSVKSSMSSLPQSPATGKPPKGMKTSRDTED